MAASQCTCHADFMHHWLYECSLMNYTGCVVVHISKVGLTRLTGSQACFYCSASTTPKSVLIRCWLWVRAVPPNRPKLPHTPKAYSQPRWSDSHRQAEGKPRMEALSCLDCFPTSLATSTGQRILHCGVGNDQWLQTGKRSHAVLDSVSVMCSRQSQVENEH